MEAPAGGGDVVHRRPNGVVFEKVPVFRRPADAAELLVDHPAGADVGVAHLRIAHLPGRQAHILPGGGEGGVGVFPPEGIHHRGGGQRDGVARGGGGQAVAVQNDEDHRLLGCGHRAPSSPQAAMMPQKRPAASAAPPMSPPSMSGWASSSRAFFSFIEPP